MESWFPKPVGAHAQSVSSPNDQAGSLFRQVFASVSSPATPTPDPEALIAVLNSQWNHDWPGAINTLRRLDQMQPGREWHAKLYAAYVNAANQAADQGNWSQARDYLNHAIVLDPTRPETRAVAARLPAPTHGAAPTGPPSPTPGPMRTAVP